MSTATTHIETEKQRVPVIRFKEFDVKWDSQLLGNIVSKVGSGSTPSGGVQVYQKTGIPFIRSQNVTGNELVLDETHISESINLKMKGSIVKPHDILLNITGGSIGRTCVVPSDFDIGNVNQHVCIIRLKSDYTPRFLQPFLASHKGQKLLYQGMTGSGREGINFQSIRLFKLNLPALPEQQKIASFLSAVDEKIQQLTKKKALLEQYKKGVMQQLFSGQLRFKDEKGNPYPDWEEKFFKDIVIKYRLGGNYTNTEEETVYPLIKMGNLGRGKIKLKKLEYIPVDEEIDSKDKIEYGDLFFNTRNTLDLVGKVSIWRNELPEAYYNSNLMYLKFEDNFFMNYRLNSYEGLKGLKRFATGTTSVAAIYTKDLLKLPLNMPCLEEQQKIATYLSRIDTKIESVNNQITQTQTFKKGLLQQMFV